LKKLLHIIPQLPIYFNIILQKYIKKVNVFIKIAVQGRLWAAFSYIDFNIDFEQFSAGLDSSAIAA